MAKISPRTVALETSGIGTLRACLLLPSQTSGITAKSTIFFLPTTDSQHRICQVSILGGILHRLFGREVRQLDVRLSIVRQERFLAFMLVGIRFVIMYHRVIFLMSPARETEVLTAKLGNYLGEFNLNVGLPLGQPSIFA